MPQRLCHAEPFRRSSSCGSNIECHPKPAAPARTVSFERFTNHRTEGSRRMSHGHLLHTTRLFRFILRHGPDDLVSEASYGTTARLSVTKPRPRMEAFRTIASSIVKLPVADLPLEGRCAILMCLRGSVESAPRLPGCIDVGKNVLIIGLHDQTFELDFCVIYDTYNENRHRLL